MCIRDRCAAARRIVGEPNVKVDEYATKLREAVYGTRFRKLYRAEAIVGLHPDFMIKAHLLVPEGHENILYCLLYTSFVFGVFDFNFGGLALGPFDLRA